MSISRLFAPFNALSGYLRLENCILPKNHLTYVSLIEIKIRIFLTANISPLLVIEPKIVYLQIPSLVRDFVRQLKLIGN